MSALSFVTGLRNDRATAIKNRLDAAATGGYFQFYTGDRPASANVAITDQVLLGTCALSDPCGTVTNGVLTFGAISDDESADAFGTATWLRAFDGDGNEVLDMDVTDSAGAGPCKLNSVNIVAGGKISITSCVFTEGNV
jgi:hypothetical protein